MEARDFLLVSIVGVLLVLVIAGLQSGFITNKIAEPEMNINMTGYYILEFEQQYWLTLDMEQGVTDHTVNSIPAGNHTQDQHFTMLMVALDQAPGSGKAVEVVISDGTNNLTVLVPNTETYGVNIVDGFDLDVSAETLTLVYSQTGGGATEHACIMMHYFYKENE